jgi:hypothetical protein
MKRSRAAIQGGRARKQKTNRSPEILRGEMYADKSGPWSILRVDHYEDARAITRRSVHLVGGVLEAQS